MEDRRWAADDGGHVEDQCLFKYSNWSDPSSPLHPAQALAGSKGQKI